MRARRCVLALLLCLGLPACAGGGSSADVPPDDGYEFGPRPDLGDDVPPGRCPSTWAYLDLCIDITGHDWEALLKDPQKEVTVPADLSIGDRTWRDVELELHGGLARTFDKKSFRAELKDDDDGIDLFGAGGERHRRFVLQAAWIDPTFLRNGLTFDLVRAEGGLAPRVTFAKLWINGALQGLYQVIERIDKPYLSRQGMDPDGNLYKAENNGANWAAKADPMSGMEHQEGEENGTEDLGVLLDALTATPATLEKFQEHVEPVLSLEDFRIYERVQSFAMNYDAFTKNYYLYHDVGAAAGTPAARFRIVSWDCDATFGMYWDGSGKPSDGQGWYAKAPWYGWDAFVPRLLSIPAYRDGYLADYRSALSGPFLPATLEARVRERAATIRDEARADLARWRPDRDFDAEVEYLVDSIATRHRTLSESLEDAGPSGPP